MTQQLPGMSNAWAARAQSWARSNTRPLVIAAAVGFGVGWFLNMWIMAAQYDGFRTPVGAPVTGAGNLLQGTIFYLFTSALLSAVISYRLIAGPERFAAEAKALPRNIKQAVADDGDQTLVHLFTGLAGSMVIVLVVGPSTAAALAAGTLLVFTPLLRPIVTGLLMRAYAWTMRRIAPRRANPPASVAMLVGILGSTGGFALGWVLPGGSTIRVLVGVLAGVGAVVLAQRGKPGAGGDGGDGTRTTMIAILAAVGAAVLVAWLADLGVAFADDGGFIECGNPGLWGWVSSCGGSGTVMTYAFIGGTATAVGAATGAALGATADGSGDGDDDGGWDGGPDDRGPGGSGSGGPDDDEDEEVPVGPGRPNPFDFDKIDLDDINWDLMPDEMKQRIRNQLIHEWREKNPGADYIRQQQAGREIDEMMEGGGRIRQWMDDAWEMTKDAAAFTWEDFKSGGALMSITGAFEGLIEGLKDGSIGLIDMVRNAPEMVGVAIEFWASQNPAESIRQIMDEIPGMTREMANQFLGMMDELHTAALAGDNQRVGQILGRVAGQLEFEVLMGAGSAKAASLGREAIEGTRLGRAVEAAEEFVHGPRRGGTGLADESVEGIRTRANDIDPKTVDPAILRRRNELLARAEREGSVKLTPQEAEELLGLDRHILDNRQGTILQFSEGSADSGAYTVYKLSDDPASLSARSLRNEHPDIWTGKWNPVNDKGFKPGEEMFMSPEDLSRFRDSPLQPGETINYNPRELSTAEFNDLSPSMQNQYLARQKDAAGWAQNTGFDSRRTVDYSQPGVKERYGEMYVAEDPANPVQKAEFWKDPEDNRVYVRYQMEDGSWSAPKRQASDIDTVTHGGGQQMDYETSRDLQYKQSMGQLGEGDTPAWAMSMLESDGAGGYVIRNANDQDMVFKAIDALQKAEGEMVVTQTLDGLTLTKAEFPEMQHLADAARKTNWSPQQAAQLRQWGILP